MPINAVFVTAGVITAVLIGFSSVVLRACRPVSFAEARCDGGRWAQYQQR
jgi:hypothetical protein